MPFTSLRRCGACVTLGACLLLGHRPAHGQEPTDGASRGDVASLLVRVASQVEAHPGRINSVWPGFWRPAPAYGLFPFGQGTLVIGAHAAVDSAQSPIALLSAPGTSPRPAQILARRMPAGRQSLPSFDLRFPVGSLRLVVVSPLQRYGGLRDSLSATVYFLLHESFHRYQQRHWASLPDSALLLLGAVRREVVRNVDDSVIQALLARERALLQRAMQAGSRTQAGSVYCDYRAEQLARYSQMPDGRALGEAYVERIEGIAAYVGYVATARILEYPDSVLHELLDHELRAPSPDDVVRRHDNWHLYASGAAKAMLLAHYLTDWQNRIAQGATLDDLLARDTFRCSG